MARRRVKPTEVARPAYRPSCSSYSNITLDLSVLG
jgi:hypothetical protein